MKWTLVAAAAAALLFGFTTPHFTAPETKPAPAVEAEIFDEVWLYDVKAVAIQSADLEHRIATTPRPMHP